MTPGTSARPEPRDGHEGPSGMVRMRHCSRSCDLSSLTSSAAHSRASPIFPASRKARAFARAWLSADRSAADSFPDRAPRAVRVPDGVLRIAAGPKRSNSISAGREISTLNALIAMFICATQLGVSCPRIEAKLADTRSTSEVAFSFRNRASSRRAPGDPLSRSQ
jgi:hypothetical protein